MRTTVNLAEDVAAELQRLRRERSIGVSEALNELARAGMTRKQEPRRPFVQRTHNFGRTLHRCHERRRGARTRRGPRLPLMRHRLQGDLIPDAQLAALSIEHGVELCSADTDFARFTEVRWSNPLAG